eukprot:Opistho-2@82101
MKTVLALFVYGTLMYPEVIRKVIGRVPEFQSAVVEGYHRFKIDRREYPAIAPTEGASVSGFIVRVSQEEAAKLDHYEGHEYVKVAVACRTDVGVVEATAYAWALTESVDLLHGTWEPREFDLGDFVDNHFINVGK